MDGYQFVASLVGSLAWPTAVAILATTQRRSVGRFIDRIKTAKMFGAEINIAEQIADVADRVDAAAAVPPAPNAVAPSLPSPVDPQVERLSNELASSSATGTIIAAWLELEEGLKRIAEANQYEWHPSSIGRNLNGFKALGLVPDEIMHAIDSLRSIRNEVVHRQAGSNVTLEDAKSYRASVREVLEKIGFNASMLSWR